MWWSIDSWNSRVVTSLFWGHFLPKCCLVQSVCTLSTVLRRGSKHFCISIVTVLLYVWYKVSFKHPIGNSVLYYPSYTCTSIRSTCRVWKILRKELHSYPGYPYLDCLNAVPNVESVYTNGVLTKTADSATEQSTCVCVSYVHVQCRRTVVRHHVQCEVKRPLDVTFVHIFMV